ncbi:rhomboid family intramembrane serine protease [Methylocystis echinoides]|uniref:rhomboid family intramembrane serine protease n=1 Tax=Methylocystis echinoides TaxID=29468 RepID=UPI00342C176B
MADDREKMLNLPGVISALLGVMAAIQLFVAVAPPSVVHSLYDAFAFIPLRLSFLLAPQRVLAALGASPLDQGREEFATLLGAGPLVYVTPITYAFLHGGWTHLLINALTLAAFGAPVARRLGGARFLWFFGACAVAGAMLHFLLHALDATPVVGASAAISGTMAAIVRFAFTPGARLGYDSIGGIRARTASLSQLRENRQAMLFLIVWFGANLLFGAFPEAMGSSEPIAWEAHLGGFVFGLLTFGAFDHWGRQV